jgi:hypothetical protein
MQNNNNKPASSARKSRGPSRKNGSKPQKPAKQYPKNTQSVGAAQTAARAPRAGMRDLKSHSVCWIAGYTYVGDGTNGATDSVYFRCQGSNLAIPGTSGGGAVPCLGSDTNIGQTYVSDIEKHFARKVVHSVKVHLVSASPATSNSMMVYIAPVRGCAASGDTVGFWGATTAAPTVPNTLGMEGSKQFASYQGGCVDLTRYIAGGSGAKQNEFNINRDGDTAATAWGSGNIDLVGLAPCAFVVTGVNGTSGLRGTNVHYVLIETVGDYLDFIAGNANPNPISFVATREEAMMALRALMSSPQKEMREHPMAKALVKYLGQGSV